MSVDPASDEYWERPLERHVQERELGVSYRLTAAEFALAQEAALVSRAFAAAGLPFDTHTFVALRIFESSVDERVDPIAALRSPELKGLIERATRLVAAMLGPRA